MSTKIKLKNYYFGTNGRWFGTIELSGANSNEFQRLGFYHGPHYGPLAGQPSITPVSSVMGGSVFDASNIARLSPGNARGPNAQEAPVISFIQSGEDAFALLNESKAGVEERPNQSNSAEVPMKERTAIFNPLLWDKDQVSPHRSDPLIFTVSPSSYWDAPEHSLGVNFPAASALALIAESSALAILAGRQDYALAYTQAMTGRITEHSEKMIDSYDHDFLRRPFIIAMLDNVGDELNEDVVTCFDLNSLIDWNADNNPYDWPVSGLCYAFPDCLALAQFMEYSSSADLSAVSADLLATSGAMNILPFRSKSFYDADFETQTSGGILMSGSPYTNVALSGGVGTETLAAQRRYYDINGQRDTAWIRYKEVKDYDWQRGEQKYMPGTNIPFTGIGPGKNIDPFEKFDMAEVVAGVYKYRAYTGHKSAFYTLRINDSGLNESLSGAAPVTLENGASISSTDAGIKLRSIAEDEITKLAKKHQPAYTQLWKIEWTGK